MPTINALRPYLEPLTSDELSILRGCEYSSPARIRGTHPIKLAHGLIARGLLENDPSAVGLFVRPTELGAHARACLTTAGAKRIASEVTLMCEEDPEGAASLEYALWRRVLVEGTLGFVPAAVQRAALATTQSPFRRGY